MVQYSRTFQWHQVIRLITRKFFVSNHPCSILRRLPVNLYPLLWVGGCLWGFCVLVKISGIFLFYRCKVEIGSFSDLEIVLDRFRSVLNRFNPIFFAARFARIFPLQSSKLDCKIQMQMLSLFKIDRWDLSSSPLSSSIHVVNSLKIGNPGSSPRPAKQFWNQCFSLQPDRTNIGKSCVCDGFESVWLN